MTDAESTGASPGVEWGLVCALKIEVAPLLAKLTQLRSTSGGPFAFRGGLLQGRRLVVVESGPGMTRAARATHALIDAHQPRWVVSVGFSGGLTESVHAGEIVVANRFVDAACQESLTVDLKMASDPEHGWHVGTLVTVERIARTVDEKRALHAATGALAVDMESLAVARVCRDRKVRLMAVRSLSDDLTADLPPEVLTVMGAKSTIRAGAIVGALWNRPSSLFDLLELRESAHRAAERLATAVEGILLNLSPAE